MAEKVVYILGAGFSAPLGIPVIGNFLEKSKDQFYANGREDGPFGHFTKVFDTIREMAAAKNYFETDLLNIEEILSILEMQTVCEDNARRLQFVHYLKDVVNHYTAPMCDSEAPSCWNQAVFGKAPWEHYGPFVSALLGHSFQSETPDAGGPSIYGLAPHLPGAFHYSVVTLNYDIVLERIAERVRATWRAARGFHREPSEGYRGDPEGCRLSKIHGTVDATDLIVPPTWNKGLNEPRILRAWRLAYQVLSEANQIRILGYSLPDSDAYVRYLLRAAVIEAPHLKRIDVFCRDGDKSVKHRYDAFVKFKNYRFKSGDIGQFLREHAEAYGNWPASVNFEYLETLHARLFA
jgi:hypothetical protein